MRVNGTCGLNNPWHHLQKISSRVGNSGWPPYVTSHGSAGFLKMSAVVSVSLALAVGSLPLHLCSHCLQDVVPVLKDLNLDLAEATTSEKDLNDLFKALVKTAEVISTDDDLSNMFYSSLMELFISNGEDQDKKEKSDKKGKKKKKDKGGSEDHDDAGDVDGQADLDVETSNSLSIYYFV